MKQFICDLCLFDESGPNVMNFKEFSSDLLPDQAFYKARATHPNKNFVIRARETSAKYPLFHYFYKNIKILHTYILTIEELDFMFEMRGDS